MSPARLLVAGGVAALIVLGAVVRVEYESYDGCNWADGDQPAITVPISLLMKEPVAQGAEHFTARACAYYGRRGFKAGALGSVPSFAEADQPEWR